MFTLISFLVLVVLDLLVVRTGAIALQMTGLSEEVASFQARSAFTGAGFTTSESEALMDHPVRRRIIATLIGLGGPGLVSTLASLIISFTQEGSHQDRLMVLVAGLVVIWVFARSAWFNRLVTAAIQRLLARFTTLDLKDYAGLLNLKGPYTVAELEVDEGDWLAAQTLRDLQLAAEGVVVLAVRKADGTFVGAPSGEHRLAAGDVLVAYGRSERLQELAVRRAHDRRAVEEAREAFRQEAAREGTV
ncbi:MAG: hypothetical protein D6701_15590 [Gemmatimonadetes bacterium]|nr:MAG: hypothetical protein D6701_15590 [Gemmatimonadota bacterium]